MLPKENIHLYNIGFYFFRDEESNFLHTTNEEGFFINSSLEEVQQQLPALKFFRANRQMLLHRQTCQRFDLLSYGKLELFVLPAFKDEIIVSQKRAGSFKSWIEKRLAS